jgi:F-type H+-transporting ATPase subunit a
VKNPKVIAAAIGALVLLSIGFLFFRSPKPSIDIKAEKLTSFGPFPLVNTYTTSIMVVIVIAVIALFATRKLDLIPRGLQNAVEAVMEALYNLCVATAGEKNGRRFFPFAASIFVFIWIANWMALLPFFNVIGSVEKVNAQEFHNISVVFAHSGGLSFIKLNQQALEFDKDKIKDACGGVDKAHHTSCIEGQRGLAIAQKLDKKEHTNSGVTSCTGSPGEEAYDQCLVGASNKAIADLNADGKQLGVLAPYFRSMNTDLNSPLSLAIMAMIFIEFWGITALGAFKYAGKFFVNPFRSPIGTIVGLLEFVAEMARIISFTFRLFGNMLAGEILLLVMTFLMPFVVALPFYALETFVGVIQAFVFFMLTVAFGALAVASHDGHADEAPYGGAESAVPAH